MTGPFGADDPAQPGTGRDLRWPAGLSPGFSDVWARSELVVLAAPAVVFAPLVAVSRWERDFAGIQNVRIPAVSGGYLEMDSEFEFELDGLGLCAQVTEFTPGSRLAWSGQGIDITAYHGWGWFPAISAGRGSWPASRREERRLSRCGKRTSAPHSGRSTGGLPT